jgi:hypothetical protein
MNKETILNRKRILDEVPVIPSVYLSPNKKLKSNLTTIMVSQEQFKGLAILPFVD